jgi:hypothetical protein
LPTAGQKNARIARKNQIAESKANDPANEGLIRGRGDTNWTCKVVPDLYDRLR